MAVLKNLGFIKEAAAFPCPGPDIDIIMQAGAEAITPVLISAVTFGCSDILKMRAGISPWHARGMRGLVEGAIPPAEKDLANGILKFTVPIEKALFFFFVVDLTVDFFARWQTGIFKLGGCNDKPDSCNQKGDTPFWLNYPKKDFFAPIYLNTTGTGGCHFSLRDRIIVPSGYFWSLFFSLSVERFGTGHVPVEVQTRVSLISPVVFNYPPNKTPAPWLGNTIRASYLAGGHNKGNQIHTYQMQAYCADEAIAISGSVNATVSKTPFVEENIVPLNCLGKDATLFG